MSVDSPYRATAYDEQSVLTTTPDQLVVMPYEGWLRFLHQAAYAMRKEDAGAGPRRGRARVAALPNAAAPSPATPPPGLRPRETDWVNDQG